MKAWRPETASREERDERPGRDDPVVVVCSADDRYAMPLAVTVRSLLENFSADRKMLLYVLDGGITKQNQRKVIASWDLGSAELVWMEGPLDRVRHLDHWLGATAFFRVLIPELLPESLGRVIYLDSDVLVLDDVTELFETDLRGRRVGAVIDGLLTRVKDGLLNHRELGLSPDAPYFNSGVLLMDLDRWRRGNIGQKALDYADRNREAIRFGDQDALNAILAGDWLELDTRWNVPLGCFGHHRCDGLAFSVPRPSILHFVIAAKPWTSDCRDPRRRLFFEYLDRTAWAGWRPRPSTPVRPLSPPPWQ